MRFNTIPTTTNHNGWPSFQLTAKQELIKMCLTSFLGNDFYEKQNDKIKRIQEYVTKVNDPAFVLALAKFSREYGLRTINNVLFVEASKQMRNKTGVRKSLSKWLAECTRRPDELAEILGYFAQSTNQHVKHLKLPNALKVALSERLASFNDFQIAKYKGKCNLFDIANLTHPKSETIGKLMTDTLESADTWEKELSENGNTKESWERLLSERKIAPLAFVRNLRNMTKVGVEENILIGYLQQLSFKDVFPFQAIQALDILSQEGYNEGSILFQSILSKVKESFQYIAKMYEGKVAIGVDVSGSMFGSNVTTLSKLDRAKMALYYGVILSEVTGGDLYLWSDKCEKVNKDMSFNSILSRASIISSGTYVSSFTNAIKDEWYDHAIILTDEQSGVPLVNVAKQGTVVWGLHDYNNTIAYNNGVVAFYWYNDTMWKLARSIFQLDTLEKELNESKKEFDLK